jgi:ABC-2 type transport system ATP-binding protein
MNFARGLLNDPWIFFLDEPTLGLDVSAARSVRELVLAWKAAVPGRTVLLTTHYMAEADELCDRIAIVDHGRILALGTPDELKKRVQRESVFRLELDRLEGGTAALKRLPGVLSATAAAEQDESRDRQTVEVNLTLEDDAALGTVVGALAGIGSHILALRKSEPSLEDVFVELVGRGFDEEPAEGEPPEPPAPDLTPDPRDTAHEPGEREEEEAVV